MPDITKGYTFTDSKADWATEKDTALRLNKMVDEAKVNITAGSGVSVTRTSGNIVVAATGGGGTVTSVSVVSANGVSGTVANPTTTPAITLALGAITPASVAASGAVAGSNLSGTNTGDQTITLTGDVTGSGTGSFAATIANDAVTYAKMQNVSAASKLLGRGDSSSGDVQEITIGSGLSMTGTTLSTSGGSAAPADADYLVKTANATLTAERVVTDSTTVTANWSTSGQVAFERAALTGDVTATANSNATTIANGVVTNAKLANSAITIAGTSTSLGSSIALDTIDGISANGLIARTAANTRAARAITAGTGITVTNGDGVSGNPTIAATAVGVPTTGNQYSRLVKDISGTITSNSHMKWVGPDVYNVKDYGAVGNDSTDDTTAIGAAFDSAITNNGTVFFPQGVYKITSSISKTVSGRLAVIGVGGGSSIIRQYGSNADGISLSVSNTKKQILIKDLGLEARVAAAGKAIYVDYTSDPSSQHNTSSVVIDGVEITGENIGGSPAVKYSWANGIHFDWVHNGTITNTFIAGKDGEYVGRAVSYTGVCVNNTIHNCQMNWWEYGIWFVNSNSSFVEIIDGSQRNHEGLFVNQVWMVPVEHGLYISGDANFQGSGGAGSNGRTWDEGRITLVNMVNSHIDSRNEGYALYIKNANSSHVNSCKLIGESTAYLSRCYESSFLNNTFFTPDGYSIDFVSGTYGSSCVVAGNVFRGGSGVIIRNDNKYIKVYGNVAQLALDVTVSNTGNEAANNSVGTVGN